MLLGCKTTKTKKTNKQWTELLDKEHHREVGITRVVTSGSLGGVMASTLAQYWRGVGLNPALGTIFPIFITHLSPVPWPDSFLYKLWATWLLNLLCVLCICNGIVNTNGIVHFQTTYGHNPFTNTCNSRGTSVAVCNEPVRTDQLMISRSLVGVMIIALTPDAWDVDCDHALSVIILIFVTYTW